MRYCRENALREFGRDVLRRCGVPDEHAVLVADNLVAANLRGVDSHGVQLLPTYVAQLESKGMDPERVGRIASESGACLVYDAENGIGQVTAERCVEQAVRLSRAFGLALVVSRNCNHFGAAAYWGLKIARAGSIGIVVCNTSPAVPPWQGRTPTLGTNPLCMAVPDGQAGRWILDMATTTVALGKVMHASYSGEPSIPEAWKFLDKDLRPTTETAAAWSGFATPVGGYKGTGLQMMVEILCGVLGGGPMAKEVAIFRQGREPLRVSHAFLAIDPGRFLGPGELEARMDRLQAMVKSSEPAPGFDEVLFAGEPEARAEAARRRGGIPVPDGLWRILSELGGEHGAPPPPAADQPFSS